MKPNRSKYLWTACIAAMAVCITMSVDAADNLGHGYVSSVTPANGECVQSTTNNGGIQFWDIAAGGTYNVTLSGIDDAADQGNDSTMQVIVHNSAGGNSCVQATSTEAGVYTFQITLTTQCLTMPIEYGTLSCNPHSPQCVPVAGCQGFGLFAQDNIGGVAGGHEGHLRTATFDESCNVTGEDTTCQGGGGSTGSITVCKYYDKNANGFQETGEPSLSGWPFCIDPLDGGTPALVTQLTGSGGCATWSNLTTPGDYVVTEANANESNWFHSTNATSLMRNANGTVHVFTNTYSAFRTWLLSATATNMAYMLSAQLAALKLDVNFNFVDGNAFDLCSNMKVNTLISTACDQLAMDGNTVAGNPTRVAQEMLKNCIDAINNNGAVVPVTPCPFSFPNPPAPCP